MIDDCFEDPEEAEEDRRERETLRSKLSFLWKRVTRYWYTLLNRHWWKPWKVDCRCDYGSNTSYDGDYCDPCGLMLYANFAILVDFVDNEMFQSYVAWDSEDEEMGHPTMAERRDEIMALYYWWTYWRNLRWTQHYTELAAIDEAEGPSFRFGRRDPVTGCSEMKLAKSPRRDAASKRWQELEAQDDEMLLRLIKVRGLLWT